MSDDYKVLFESAKTPIVIMDKEGRYIEHNKAFRLMIGCTSPETLNCCNPVMLSPSHQPGGEFSEVMVKKHIRVALEEGIHEFSWLGKDQKGNEFLSVVRLERLFFKGELCLIATVHEVEEALRLTRMVNARTEKIREKLRKLEIVFENGIVGIMISLPNRIVHECNRKMADIFRCQVTDIVGKTLERFHYSNSDFNDFGTLIENTIVNGQHLTCEKIFQGMDGATVWCEINGRAIDSNIPPDMSKGILWIIRDVTARKILENELAEQYLLAKDANPLTGLPGNNTIKEHLKIAIERHESRGILYIDIDHFKSYNDRYGFAKGDEVLLFVADILREAGSRRNAEDYFVGNVGGDDFVVIADGKFIKEIGENIIQCFDQEIVKYYNADDQAKGYIRAIARDGTTNEIPLMSISIACVCLNSHPHLNYLEVIDICTCLKQKAKSQSGSVLIYDRRN